MSDVIERSSLESHRLEPQWIRNQSTLRCFITHDWTGEGTISRMGHLSTFSIFNKAPNDPITKPITPLCSTT